MTAPGRETTAQDIVTEAFHFALDGNREDAETAIEQMTDAERDELRCACKALLSSLARETPATLERSQDDDQSPGGTR